MKVLIFSDIHGDLGALARLMDTEADYYVAAGDLVNFGRGLDRTGEILARRADRVYVLPGNHETAAQIAGLCRDFGLHDFHGQHAQWDRYRVAGLGYSNPTPFDTPGEYTEAELAFAAFGGLAPLVLICHCPPHGTTLDKTVRDCTPDPRRSAISWQKNRPRTSPAVISTKLPASLLLSAGPRRERRQARLAVGSVLAPRTIWHNSPQRN